MEVTVSAFTLTPAIQSDSDAGEVRIYYTTSFDSDGVSVFGSSTFADNFYANPAWAKDGVTGQITVESFDLISTINSSNPSAQAIGVLYDDQGTIISQNPVFVWVVPNSLGSTTTKINIDLYNASFQPVPPLAAEYLNRDQVAAMIAQAVGDQAFASTGVAGIVYAADTPAVADEPTAVMINSYARTNKSGIGKSSINRSPASDTTFVETTDPRVTADEPANVAAIRALGTGALEAAAGDDARFPSESQTAALEGTYGVPSDLNLFVTDQDPRLARSPLIYVMQDEFIGATGAVNAGRTPTISNFDSVWINGSGSGFTIQGNHLEPPSGFADGDFQYIETGLSDLTVMSYLTGYANTIPGVMFRLVDSNNFWVFQADISGPFCYLYKRVAGVYSLEATFNSAPGIGVTTPFTITARGSLITVQISGQTPQSITSTVHQTATKVGVRAGRDGVPGAQPKWELFTVIPAIVKSANNPLISKAAATWKSVDVAAPNPFYDHTINQWAMDYSGFNGTRWCTGFAYANDPINGPWVDDPANPVIVPTIPGSYIAGSSAVVLDGDTYYIVYNEGPVGGPFRVYAKSSTDRVNWTPLNSGLPILPFGGGGSFDELGQHDPDLRLRDDGLWEIIFAGRSAADVYTIGHAIGLSVTNWGATSQLPILGQFSGNPLGQPSFSGNDPVNYSVYFVRDPSNARYILRSDTNDGGASFSFLEGVLYSSTSGWDDVQVFDPAPIQIGTTLALFYSGANTVGGTENLNAGIGSSYFTPPLPIEPIEDGAWVSYTSTVTSGTGTITTLGSVTASYHLTEQTIIVRLTIPITTNGTAAGFIRATLPFTASAHKFSASGIETVAKKGLAGLIGSSGTAIDIYFYDGTYPGADGREMVVTASYEIA